MRIRTQWYDPYSWSFTQLATKIRKDVNKLEDLFMIKLDFIEIQEYKGLICWVYDIRS